MGDTSAQVFKLRGYIAGAPVTVLLDTGADANFINAALAQRCNLPLRPSGRSVRLPDGTLVPAGGEANVLFTLDAGRKSAPHSFTADFTSLAL